MYSLIEDAIVDSEDQWGCDDCKRSIVTSMKLTRRNEGITIRGYVSCVRCLRKLFLSQPVYAYKMKKKDFSALVKLFRNRK